MLADIYSKDGKVTGQVELKDDIFAIEPNEHAMHQAVVSYLAAQRHGTAKTKTKAEVSGGGKKPWRQKGRGTARSGSSRSPVWVHGGTAHGPQPHEYSVEIQKKVKKLARKSAFSQRLLEKNLMVVEDFTFEVKKTKQMATILKNLNLVNAKTLVLLEKADENVFFSSRNIAKLSVFPADKISTYHILNHRKILILKGALDTIEKTF
jgi:large subunit ribosomal protein L4